MQQQQQIKFKRGNTVMLGCQAYDDEGRGADLSLVEVAAQVRGVTDAAPMVASLDLVWVDRVGGAYELWAPGDGLSTDWPLGNLRVDIRYSQQVGARTLRRSTETFFIFIDREVTA